MKAHPQFLPRFHARRFRQNLGRRSGPGLLLLSGLLLSGGALNAQTNYFWDTGTGGGLQSGAGTWSTGTSNWNDSVGTASANIGWSGTNNIANFSGSSGVVTVNEIITLSRLNLTSGYSFSGSGGGLDFGSNAGVINTSSNIAFGIGLAGSSGITKSGTGTFTYTGTGTYTGVLAVSGGTFTLGNTTATTNRLDSTSSLTIGSSSALGQFTMVAPTSAASSQTFANLSVGSGLNTLSSSGAVAANIANIAFSGTYTRSNTGVLSLANATGFNITSNFGTNNGTHIIDGVLVGVNRSNNTFVASNNTANGAPAGTNNTWSPTTHTVATSNNGTAYTGTTASLRLSGTRTVTLGTGAVINTGMITNNGGSSLSLITGGSLTSGNGRDIIILGGDSAYRTQIDSQIVNNGATSIGLLISVPANNSSGSVLINGNNTYTGNTTLAGGTVSAGSDTAFGVGGTITFAGGTLLANANRSLANDIALPFNSTLGTGAYNMGLSGTISGAGTFTLNNTGTTTLSGNNTGHTGQVIVNNAATTLALGSANAIGSGGVSLAVAGTVTSSDGSARSVTITNYTAAGGTFGTTGTGDLNVTLPGLGASAFNINVGNSLTTIANPTLTTGAGATWTKSGNGTLAFGGDFSVFGSASTTGVTINAGTLQIGAGGTSGSLTVTGAAANINGAAGTLAFNRSNNLSFGTTITGGVGVQQKGGGTTTLTATNTYTGVTDVNAGTLKIDTAGSIANSTAINVASGGKLIYNSSTALTVAPILNGNGSSNRAIHEGTGTINASLTLNNVGDTLSPGNSPGILPVTGNQTWASFGYDWEVNNFTGTTAGTHFDQIAVTGTLNLSGGSGAYLLNILSLTAGNVAGDTPNFSEIDRSWKILTSTSISNFNPANWTINAAGFTNLETGNWAIAQSGNDLVLTYTAIPEPNVAGLLGGLGVLALLRRRRQ